MYGFGALPFTVREEHRLREFENRVLKRIFGPKSNQVTEEWRRLHNQELYALYYSPDIFRMIKSRRMRLAGRIAQMGRREVYIGFWWETLKKNTPLKT